MVVQTPHIEEPVSPEQLIIYMAPSRYSRPRPDAPIVYESVFPFWDIPGVSIVHMGGFDKAYGPVLELNPEAQRKAGASKGTCHGMEALDDLLKAMPADAIRQVFVSPAVFDRSSGEAEARFNKHFLDGRLVNPYSLSQREPIDQVFSAIRKISPDTLGFMEWYLAFANSSLTPEDEVHRAVAELDTALDFKAEEIWAPMRLQDPRSVLYVPDHYIQQGIGRRLASSGDGDKVEFEEGGYYEQGHVPPFMIGRPSNTLGNDLVLPHPYIGSNDVSRIRSVWLALYDEAVMNGTIPPKPGLGVPALIPSKGNKLVIATNMHEAIALIPGATVVDGKSI
ncbi:MAG: hypothetical protein V1735_00485 [Nanoarchaeota archaeon]